MKSSDFLVDKDVSKALDDVARRFVVSFCGRYPHVSVENGIASDEAYWDARQDATLFLAKRKHLVDEARATGDWRRFTGQLYKSALYDKRMAEFARRRIESISPMAKNMETYYIRLLARKCLDHQVGGLLYTESDVRRLAVLCWEPERLSSNKDPFGENIPHEDDPFWRKATSDPSHRGTEIAEMIDMRSAFHWIEGDKYHNPAGLTKPEIRAFYTVCVEDMTQRDAALVSGRSQPSILEALDKALSKLVTYMNNPKGRCDDE